MVAGDDDRGGRPIAGGRLIESLHQPSDLRVHRFDLAQVRRVGMPCVEWVGWGVRRVRIEIVHPEELGMRSGRGEMSERAIGRLIRRPLRRACRQLVVVEVEAACQAESARQHERGDERRRLVAALLQSLGRNRVRRGKEAGVLVDAVARGIESRHH